MAAAYRLREELKGTKVGLVCSGGNTSLEQLKQALSIADCGLRIEEQPWQLRIADRKTDPGEFDQGGTNMAKAIEQLPSGITVGHVGLGYRSGVAGSVRQQVHDGDTIVVRAIGSLGVRFPGRTARKSASPFPGTGPSSACPTPAGKNSLPSPSTKNFLLSILL